ncbi:kynurenine/alpha-aminoadipate aminotransferase, mitochondrial-like [Hylaeus anthracinus]|uniref:kynurenine/alpha-aminoadipate aminotransferase, mitochondrial-like n=1 Tax=Hylaeus anthracinus TaxID=313031 RepID=UPI0023B91CA8|nr:kynurenine/alpha-aminoadipate aminotransferase, mitochondrial-like [Hylaeus anthracinus]
MDFAKFVTAVSNRRKSSILRKWALEFMKRPKSVSLANGMPNAETFPFEELSVTYKDGTTVKLVGNELSLSLQYGPSQGYLPLMKKIREFQEHWHTINYPNWDVHITSGSMDACSKVFEMTLEPGDAMMAQVPTYNGITNALAPLMPEFIGIKQDGDGVIPEEIKRICEERLRDKKPMPKILYVNPTGANPTGTVLPTSRKKKIYELSQKYDFLIVEDDPYYFLHFLDERPKSFLEFDTEGRVIRLDSFSKILSAGLRLGVVTAHEELVKKLVLHTETTTIHASSLSQMLLYKLLETWDTETLHKHFDDVQRFYRERRDIMLASIQKHLADLGEWNIPKGGMFFWVKVNKLEDVMDLAVNKCASEGVFLIPGNAFNYNLEKSQYLRLSYSSSTAEEIEKAICTLAKLMREEVEGKTGARV